MFYFSFYFDSFIINRSGNTTPALNVVSPILANKTYWSKQIIKVIFREGFDELLLSAEFETEPLVTLCYFIPYGSESY